MVWQKLRQVLDLRSFRVKKKKKDVGEEVGNRKIVRTLTLLPASCPEALRGTLNRTEGPRGCPVLSCPLTS